MNGFPTGRGGRGEWKGGGEVGSQSQNAFRLSSSSSFSLALSIGWDEGEKEGEERASTVYSQFGEGDPKAAAYFGFWSVRRPNIAAVFGASYISGVGVC